MKRYIATFETDFCDDFTEASEDIEIIADSQLEAEKIARNIERFKFKFNLLEVREVEREC